MLASAGMGVISWLGLHLLNGPFNSGGTMVRSLVAIVLMAVGGATYLLLARLLKLGEARQIWTTILGIMPGNRGPQ
jgi:peptidoglycan biosynthesis protein MviN/MurJ (putative lipid II flippase)